MASADKSGAIDPMKQFAIKRFNEFEVFGVDASFTNSALWMVIAISVVTLFFLLATGKRTLVPSRMQSMAELAYEFIAGTVRQNVGTEGMKYFPLIFTLFMFVLACNVLGMIPYSFTVTSHIIVTFALAAMVFIVVTVVGFFRHGIGYFKLFAPDGVPTVLLPIIFPIELVSYLMRPVSLSVRLFANMLAGHAVLKVFASFVAILSAVEFGVVGAIAPFGLMLGLTALEFLVAVLQAYVFTVLTCIYLHDAIHLH